MQPLSDKKEINKYILLFSLTYMISYITRINYGAVILEMENATQLPKTLLSMALTGFLGSCKLFVFLSITSIRSCRNSGLCVIISC